MAGRRMGAGRTVSAGRRMGPALAALGGAAALLVGALYITFNTTLLGVGGPGGASEPASNVLAAGPACPADDFATRIAGRNVGAVAGFEPLATPVDLSALAFRNADGEPVTLADFRGRTVLVNLWATWCAPCREEMPALQALNEAMDKRPFEVVAVSIDAGTPAKPLAFYAETGLDTLPFYHDGSMATFSTLKKADLAPGLPTSVLVGPDGCARGVLKGPAAWAGADARDLIEATLQ